MGTRAGVHPPYRLSGERGVELEEGRSIGSVYQAVRPLAPSEYTLLNDRRTVLPADTEACNKRLVTLGSRFLQVIQESATLGDHC